MYGLLSTSTSGSLKARYPILDNFEVGVQELTDAEQKSRALRLLTALTSAFPDVNAKGAAYMALRSAWQAAWPYIAGGDVDYAVHMAVAFYKFDDLGWVQQTYHRRLLAGTRVVVVDDPFDVTVHLWQRYPGNTLPPGRPLGANDRLPLMNTDGWYDTFTTCCVLHVKAALH